MAESDWDQERLAQLREQVDGANAYLSLMTEGWKRDPKCLIELGYAIMLEKPLLFVMPEGTVMPRALARLADDVETYSPTDSPEAASAAVQRLIERHDAREAARSSEGATMPPRLTACVTCKAPISDFPDEATKLYGRRYERLVEVKGREYCPTCATLARAGAVD